MKTWNGSRAGEVYRDYRPLVWLCIVIMVNQLGFGAITPVIPLFAKSFGVSQSAIGLSLSVYGLARFLVNMPTGQLSDRIGRRWTLVIGEAITVLGNLLCGMTGSFEQFLLFRFLSGVGGSMVVVSGQVILADISTRANRGRVMAIYQGMFLVGVGLGPLPGGLLAERYGLSVPFFVFAAVGVIAGIIAFDKVPETRGVRERREGLSMPPGGFIRIPFTVQLRAMLSNIGFVLVSLVTLTQFFARTGSVFAVLPIMASVKMGASPDQIGVLLSTFNLVSVAMVYFAGSLVDKFGRKPVIVPSTMLAALSMAAFALAPDYGWLLAASALWGIAGGIAGPAPAAYAADMAPLGMNAMAMSSYRMIADLGYVVGPLAAGWMADAFSNEVSMLVTGALFLVSGGLFALFAPETKSGQDREVPVATKAG